jgi:hypothetical protein
MNQELPTLNIVIWINTRPSQSINHTAVLCYNVTDYKRPKFTAANYLSKSNTPLRIRD